MPMMGQFNRYLGGFGQPGPVPVVRRNRPPGPPAPPPVQNPVPPPGRPPVLPGAQGGQAVNRYLGGTSQPGTGMGADQFGGRQSSMIGSFITNAAPQLVSNYTRPGGDVGIEPWLPPGRPRHRLWLGGFGRM